MVEQKGNTPQHIAIIMDGNGRWARKRGLPKIVGYTKGIESLRRVLQACGELHIPYLTVYAFSTENWRRPKYEVDDLMELLESHLDKETENLRKNNVRLNAIGRLWELPESIQRKLNYAMEITKHNNGVIFTIAINYGGRAEIVDAVRAILDAIKRGESINSIDEQIFSSYLYTKDMPDPDLLIRTSGELRISNFLLWQSSYTELYVTDRLWPDFGKKDLRLAIEEYKRRHRRYGG